MATVKIKKKPSKKVSNLGAPTISGNTATAKWKVPAAMTKEKSKSRATSLKAEWVLNIGGKNQKITSTLKTSATSAALNLNSFKIGKISYNRNSFYPVNANNKLASVSISVAGVNSKGTGTAAKATTAFITPPSPEIGEISFDKSTGICSCTIKKVQGSSVQEQYDIRYRVTVEDTHTGEILTTSDGSSRSEEFHLTYDASGYQNLTHTEHIRVTVEAWSRGYAGDSEPEGKHKTRNFYLSYPAQATIDGVYVTSKDSTGSITANIKTNESTEHPVDVVTLQYLANVTYEKTSDIPANASWSDSDIEDNGRCTALTVPIANLMPDRGKHTWVRVKSIHAHENVLVRYSDYMEVADLYEAPASATEANISIISATAASGESARVILGWDGSDDFTGTELSWSDDEEAWRSTEEPSKFEFTWSDGRYPATGTKKYNDSAEIVIKGLKEGTKYTIKARRYLEGDTTVYGNYSSPATVLTTEKPQGVVASCKSSVPDGEPLEVYWSFSGNGTQTKWAVRNANGVNIAEGEGSYGATQISAERLKDMAVNNVVSFKVWVSTGSGEAESELHSVKISKKPTITVNAPATLKAQPYTFSVKASEPCDLIVIVTARDSDGQTPYGSKSQVDGDTVHSDVYSPVWNNGEASITLPFCDFHDLGTYTLSVIAESRDTKLRSAEFTKEFDIAWTHQAVDPDDFVTITPIDETTEDGEHIQGVDIELTPPDGCKDTDVYDIYRMDGDNAYLIGEGFPLTYSVRDVYAPFGDDVLYRVAIRTADGDTEFAEKEYVLQSKTVRIDWSGGTLELPYGLSVSDGYRKDVEFRQHMDGSVDGYWNPNIERKGSYSSSVIKLVQPDEINLARALARYPGAVFIRTPNGSAFTADAQVTDLSAKNEAVTLIAIDATEVGITEEFMLPSPNEV